MEKNLKKNTYVCVYVYIYTHIYIKLNHSAVHLKHNIVN